MNSTKISRAFSKAKVGAYRRTSAAMLNHIPNSVITALSSGQLAELLDGMYALAQASKAIAEAEALQLGAIWDPKQQALREIQ